MTGDPATHHPLLRRYLVVTASDGYQIVLSGGELDANFGNTPVLLAWAEEGAPLPADEGPAPRRARRSTRRPLHLRPRQHRRPLHRRRSLLSGTRRDHRAV